MKYNKHIMQVQAELEYFENRIKISPNKGEMEIRISSLKQELNDYKNSLQLE
jgi:hypothetical protein